MDTAIAKGMCRMILRGAVVLAATLTLPTPSSNMLATPAAELARAYASYKFVGSPPLPLRNVHEDWGSARIRMSREPTVARWVAVRRQEVEEWFALERDDAEWIAGWGHDLTDSATGQPMLWTRDLPEPPQGSDAQNKIHGAWVHYRRSDNIAATLDAARLWRLTGEPRYRDWAAAQLDCYAANYALWPERLRYRAYSRMMGQSLDEATNGTLLADVMRLLGDEVAPERRRQWCEGLFAPLLVNLERSNLGRNNIAVWQASAAAVLAIELDDEAALRRALQSDNGIRAMLRKGVQSDFTWFEPSLGYTNYTLRALSMLFVHAGLSGRGNLMERERLLAQNMIAALLEVRFSSGSLPALGDTSTRLRGIDPELLSLSQRTMPLRVGVLPLSWHTLLDPAQAAPPPPESASRIWEAAQFAMLRTDGTELFTHWGQRHASHAQQDALSWEAHIGGLTVSQSAGIAHYGTPLFLKYLRTAAAHNMPVIEGIGPLNPGLGKLIAYDSNGLMAQTDSFADAQVKRSFRIDGRSVKTRTIVRLRSRGNRRLGEIFNTECAVTPGARLHPVATPPGVGFDWWRGTLASMPSADWRATLMCDGELVTLRWHADRAGRVYVSRAPDATGSLNRTALYFEANASELTIILNLDRR